jgi:hypothetical protein
MNVKHITLLSVGALMLFIACSPRPSSPEALLAAMEKTYLAVPAMRFSAISMMELIGDKPMEIEVRGKMDFVRPDQLELAWESTTAKFNGSIVQTNHEIHMINGTSQPVKFTSLTQALESAAKTSGELACFVPELLIGETNRLNLVQVSMKPDIEVDGDLCYCIVGTNSEGHSLELAINKKTLFIQQIIDLLVINQKEIAKRLPNAPSVPDIGEAKVKRTLKFKVLGTK